MFLVLNFNNIPGKAILIYDNYAHRRYVRQWKALFHRYLNDEISASEFVPLREYLARRFVLVMDFEYIDLLNEEDEEETVCY